MPSLEVAEQLKELTSTLASVESVLDVPKLEVEVTELEKQASAPDLWDDQERAQAVTSRLSFVQERSAGSLHFACELMTCPSCSNSPKLKVTRKCWLRRVSNSNRSLAKLLRWKSAPFLAANTMRARR